MTWRRDVAILEVILFFFLRETLLPLVWARRWGKVVWHGKTLAGAKFCGRVAPDQMGTPSQN